VSEFAFRAWLILGSLAIGVVAILIGGWCANRRVKDNGRHIRSFGWRRRDK
jgi:hypothetical protein